MDGAAYQVSFEWLLPVRRRRPPRAWGRPPEPRVPLRPRARAPRVLPGQVELRLPPARPALVDVPLGWLHTVGRRRSRGEEARPRRRRECADVPRPCPFVGCRHHLFLEVGAAGELHLQPHALADLRETCSLDVAERVAAEDQQLSLYDLALLLGRRKETLVALNREASAHLRIGLEE